MAQLLVLPLEPEKELQSVQLWDSMMATTLVHLSALPWALTSGQRLEPRKANR